MKRISSDSSLNEILPLLAENTKGLSIEDKDGKIIGVATPQGVIKIMASAALEDKKKEKII